MTPKEKANELVDKMYNVDFHDDAREIAMRYPHAIKCALVAVEELLSLCWNGNKTAMEYWQQVKNEIEKL
jgi:hypothetical protein